MRYRKLSAEGDYTFGQSQANFYINNPEAVAQAVRTRLLLIQGEWFLNDTEGTPYRTQILGKYTRSLYDAAIRTVVLDTEGVLAILNYASQLDGRQLNVQMTIDTIYGQTPVVQVL